MEGELVIIIMNVNSVIGKNGCQIILLEKPSWLLKCKHCKILINCQVLLNCYCRFLQLIFVLVDCFPICFVEHDQRSIGW